MPHPATAEDYQVINDHLLHWQAWCSESKVDLSTTAFLSPAGLVLIDPIRLARDPWAEILEKHGAPVQILLTNGNHERASHWYVENYGCEVLAHPEAVPELIHPPTDTLAAGAEPFCGCRIIELRGAASGEVGIYLEERHSLILGDIIINLDSFRFDLLPDKYATDPSLMRQSLAQLLTLPIQTLTFAHGMPITAQINERLRALLEG